MTVAADAFELRGVVHLVQPWAPAAADLEQLRAGIAAAPATVLFRHAVQCLLRHAAAEQSSPDDFSAWVGGVLQDNETAERLSFAVQGHGESPEALRSGLLAVLDAIPGAKRAQRTAPPESPFPFLAATSVPFDTGVRANTAEEVVEALAHLDAGVWFFHLVEEPWFAGGRAPLLEWLASGGQARLVTWLGQMVGSGLPIDQARSRLLRRWRRSRIGARLAEATAVPEITRREAGRETVARLLRRRRRPESDA